MSDVGFAAGEILLQNGLIGSRFCEKEAQATADSKCPTCGQEFHLLVEVVNQQAWYAEHAPDKQVGVVVNLATSQSLNSVDS
jgi:hypothetical protein